MNKRRVGSEKEARAAKYLEEAGMQTVITELQRQLDAWIAEYPDWNPLERS